MLRRSPFLLAAVIAGLLGGGCEVAERPAATEADIAADVEAYRQQRTADLKAPDSWLTLVALYWLKKGENRFGSDTSASDFVVPGEGVPPQLGTFIREDSTVRVRIAPEVAVMHEGVPVDTLMLVSDHDGAPTILEWGSLSWYLIERNGRLGIRLKDSQSAALAAFDSIDTYSIDPQWYLAGHFDRYDPPKTIPILNIIGDVADEPVPGALVFEKDGQMHRLDVTGVPTDSTFFLIFGDETNGTETYSGGRYLWIDAPGDDGSVVIDFNKAYNPPCVFSPYATCPLPPRQNRLPIRVEAGEKMFEAH